MTSPKLGCCKVILLLVGMSACFFLPAHAQTENGAIRGSVTDPSGALVPGASVRLIDDDRGLQTEVATGNGGGYTFSTVRPGHYRMEVEKSGFKLARLTGITLNVLENQEQNFRLDVGPVSDSITVKANALNVNTSDGTVSAVVDRTFADNLPLNGRSFQTLIMLTPGVVVAPTAFDDQGQFSVNGQRADANYFAVDGVSANFGVTGYTALVQAAGGALPALSVSGGTNSLVSVDAMQEFRVQTSSYAPEFGRTPGGQISIATRSGTNAFHGTLFEYFRNDALDASDWFVGFNQLRRPEERQNDFGGVFGGPILKDKTFFFFSYEGLRLRQPSTQETLVPDNASRQQAPTGIQPFMNAYPVQNGPEAGSGLAQFNASYSNPSSLDAYSIRVDQVVNSKMNLFGRYNYSPSTFTLRGPLVTTPVLSTSESELSSIQTLTLGFNHLLTARITNEIRANYSNDRVGTKFILDNSGGAVPLPDSLVFPSGYSSANAIFSLTITGAGTYQKGKQATDEQRQVNLIDNLSLIIGGHQLKFGVDYRWLSPFSSPSGYRQQANFLGVTCSTPPCSGYAISGTSEFAVTYAFQSDALLTPNYSVYGQDTWRISPRLTMTYGLRWDINPALKGKTMADQPFTVTGLNDPATIALAPRGTPLYQTTYGNVAPRIGAAYQPRRGTNWDSVLRGGFGIFYDLGHGSLGGASGYFPFFALKIIPSASFPLSPGDATPPVLTTNPPVNTMIVADRHLKLPRTYEWNGAFEQSVGKSQTLSLTYVGAVGRDLLRETNIVVDPAVNPNFSFMDFTDNSAKSDYHALQAKFEKRLSQGLQALMSYTWSHSIDIASTDAFATYLNTPSFIGNPNIDRGNSNFDIRHAFTAGVTYNVPTPGWNDFARAVLGGWSVDSFVFAQSAPPVDVIGGYSFADGTAIRYRPNVNHGIPLVIYNSQDPGGKHFNKNAFSSPPPGQQGDLGRNVLRGFGAVHADFAIQRQFQFTERVALRLRGEFFNIFNHPNFGPPINDLTSALFGRSTQTLASSLGSGGPNGGFNPLYQIGGPRSIQLALKLQF
jgi:hypothetical protein